MNTFIFIMLIGAEAYVVPVPSMDACMELKQQVITSLKKKHKLKPVGECFIDAMGHRKET